MFGSTYRTNLTFLNFTVEFDTTRLQCGSITLEVRDFFLGFPVSPKVRNDLATQVLLEGDNLTLDLSINGVKDPFPPNLTFVWTFNGQNFTSFSSVSADGFNISFNSIQRNMSGEYTLIVTNSVGSVSGSFEVDVQFPPEATPVEQSEIVLPNSWIILVAFLPTIDGNPVPNASWTGPDGQPRNNIGRFDTSVPGQIVITDTREGDNGSYTCTLRNGISPDQSQDVELLFAVPTGPPQNLLERDVTDTTVNLTWSLPDNLGIPELSFYQILVSPPLPSGVNLTTAKTSLLLHNLIPGTLYNITVVGVSIGENFGTLEGEKSNLISFRTPTGAPSIDSVIAIPRNGIILIKWTLKHTGGLNVSIYSYCEVDKLGAVSRLVSLQLCDYDNCFISEVLTSSTSIDNVQSGQVYSCRVTAVNSKGTDTIMVSSVFSNEGLPSIPNLVSSSTLPFMLKLILRAEFAGVSDDSFRFKIKILNATNGSIFRIDTYLFPHYKDNETVTVNIVINEGGAFTFVLLAVNSFGYSSGDTTISGVTITRVTSSTGMDYSTGISLSSDFIQCTPTNSIPEQIACQSISDRTIAGVTVAIIIILMIIGVVIITVILIRLRSKGNAKAKKKQESDCQA